MTFSNGSVLKLYYTLFAKGINIVSRYSHTYFQTLHSFIEKNSPSSSGFDFSKPGRKNWLDPIMIKEDESETAFVFPDLDSQNQNLFIIKK